jgi:hypothetical protein
MREFGTITAYIDTNRYYGPAITSERSMGAASTRITIDQLMLVALGSLFAAWDYKVLDAFEASTIIQSMYKCLLTKSRRRSKFPVSKYKTVKNELIGLRGMNADWLMKFNSGPNWVRALEEAGSVIREAKDLDREICLKLLALGMGSGASFLAEKGTHPAPIFGLGEFSAFIAALETDEDRIAILRKYASICFPDAPPGKVIIRYNPDSPRKFQKSPEARKDGRDTEKTTKLDKSLEIDEAKLDKASNAGTPVISIQPAEDNETDTAVPGSIPYEYATAFPTVRYDLFSTEKVVKSYYRWFDRRIIPIPLSKTSIFDKGSITETIEQKSAEMYLLQHPAREDDPILALSFTTKNPAIFEAPLRGKNDIGLARVTYELFIGDPDIAAIFVASDLHEQHKYEARMPYWATKKRQWNKKVDIKDVQLALNSGSISAQCLDAVLRHQDRFHYTSSLMALAAVQDTYKELHSATIDPSIALKPFHKAACLEGYQGLYMGVGYQAPFLTRERAFACITLLETGSLDYRQTRFSMFSLCLVRIRCTLHLSSFAIQARQSPTTFNAL